jgi:choline transport protein
MGPFCNAFSVAWVGVYTVLFCFPVFLPVDAGSMNYLGVVVVGVGLLILVLWWGGKRRTFVGPVVVVVDDLDTLDDSVAGTSSSSSPLKP